MYKCGTLNKCVSTAEDCKISNIICPDLLPFLCPIGECRQRPEDCPTSVTCPVGYIKCEDDSCVKTLDECR